MSHAILFDGDQVQPLDALSDRPQHLGGSMLLWVDVAREAEDVHEVAVAFGIDDETQALLVHSGDHAHFQDHGA